MTQDQFMGIVRQVLPIIGGLLTALGWLSPETVAQLSGVVAQGAGAVFVLVGLVWAYKANSKSSIIASATQMPEVNSAKLATAVNDPDLKKIAANAPAAS